MKLQGQLYGTNLSLLTDLYQLSMAYGYWKQGITEHEAVFNLFTRKNPFKGGYTIAAGLAYITEFLENFGFEDDDIEYLREIKGNDGKPLFEEGFLTYLKEMEFSCEVYSVPEGTVVFPQEPLVRVRGPLIQCQLIETPLLNIFNFQSLIATKAARVCQAAGPDEPVLEFGLRRAQGIDGGIAASRAAYIGGCAGTSNVLAGKLLGIPVKGTHAHSWVMSFDSELEAFEKYAEAMPNNCVFLVDTYDTLQGVRHAIQVGEKLRERGYEMAGIRLDSGDLAYLSIEARKILDEAGFENTKIVASNDLDEHIIESLHLQDSQINTWGVGTKLATAYDQAALGGVYKISAIRAPGEEWKNKVKLSEQRIKISNPGVQQVRRFYGKTGFAGDMIYNALDFPEKGGTIVDPQDPTRRKKMPEDMPAEDLLIPIFENGKCVYQNPELPEIQQRTTAQLTQIHRSIRRFTNPHEYPVGLEKSLHVAKTQLIMQLREGTSE